MLNNNTSHIPIYETRKFVEIVSRFRPQNVFLVRERSELCCLAENRMEEIARFSSPHLCTLFLSFDVGSRFVSSMFNGESSVHNERTHTGLM